MGLAEETAWLLLLLWWWCSCSLLWLRVIVSHLSDRIAKLETLKVVDISFNELEQLPFSLFHLPQLKQLSVAHNKVRTFARCTTLAQARDL